MAKDPDDPGTIDLTEGWPVYKPTEISERVYHEWAALPFEERPPLWEWVRDNQGIPVKGEDNA